MKRSISIIAFCGIWLGGGSVYAGHLKEYFPLKKGNRWDLYNQEKSKKWKIEITGAQGSFYLLKGFPWGGDSFWVNFTGNTLYRWNSSQKKWQAFLPFGDPLGNKRTLHIGTPFMDYPYTTVELMSVGMTVENPVLGMKQSACKRFELYHQEIYTWTRFRFDFAPKLGPWGMSYANALMVGLLGTADTDQKFAYLRYARINGKNIGFVEWSNLASSGSSTYLSALPQVLLIKDLQQWMSLYPLYTGKANVPEVDFSKNSVLAVIAAENLPVGSSVEIEKLVWDYLTTKVTAWVRVVKPVTMMNSLWEWRNPYTMILIPASVSQGKGIWLPTGATTWF